MNKIVALLLCWTALSAVSYGGTLEKYENQRFYDNGLIGVLNFVMDLSNSFPPNSEPIVSEGHEFYGVLKPGDELSRGIPSRIVSPYTYLIESVSQNGIRIEAVNQYGGRNYIYDYQWNVAYYVFSSEQELQKLGRTVLDCLTTDKYADDPRVWKDRAWKGVVTALGYRGCYAKPTTLSEQEKAKFDMLGALGVFITNEKLRAEVWECIQGINPVWDDIEREKCVRGVISYYENYSPELQKEVLSNVSKYLASVDDEKTKYSKKIADFVLEKGGAVPNREYWAYDTSWIPFEGTVHCRKEGNVKYRAGQKVNNVDEKKEPLSKEGVNTLFGVPTGNQPEKTDNTEYSLVMTNSPPRAAEAGSGFRSLPEGLGEQAAETND